MTYRLILHIFILLTLSVFTGCQEKTDTAGSLAFTSVFKNFDHFNYTDNITRSLDSVVSQYPGLKFSERFDYYNYKCGYYRVAKRDDVRALIYSDSLLLLVNTQKQNPDNTIARQALANLAKGSILFALKKYNDALHYFYQSKIAAEKSGDADIISDLNYNMGMVMFRKQNYRQAAHYFMQAFQQPGENKHFGFSKFYRMQEVLNNVAESYTMANEPDSALLYSTAGKNFIEQNEKWYPGNEQLMEVAKAVTDGTAGQAYLIKKNIDAGEALLHKSIAVNSKPGYDNGNAVQMQLSLAQFYLDNDFDDRKPEKESALLEAISKGLDTLHNQELQTTWNYLTSRYYDKMHNQAMALSYLKKGIEYDKIKDEENKALNETNISAYFQVMQGQYEVQLLKKNSDIEQIYLIIAVILFVLCSIIILLIWRYWRQSKKHVTLLTRLNKKIGRQKKKLEQTLSALNKRSEEKDHILKVIAHDLRNPISAINALSKLLKDDPTLDEEQTECLNLIGSASVESLDLINAIMQIEDNSSGQQDADRQVHDINKIILNCVNQLKAPAAGKNQLFTVQLPPEEQLAFVNTDKIQRVIKNLLSNAMKFSHKGSIIYVSVKQKENNIIVKIRDHGIGIPEHLQHKVFDIFTEAKRPGTEHEKTFGLGLSICKQFVEAHGGKIWFNSKENQGTSFYVKLQKQDTIQAISSYHEVWS